MDDLKVTYRGIEVPEDIYAVKGFAESPRCDAFMVGVDAALDGMPKPTLRVRDTVSGRIGKVQAWQSNGYTVNFGDGSEYVTAAEVERIANWEAELLSDHVHDTDAVGNCRTSGCGFNSDADYYGATHEPKVSSDPSDEWCGVCDRHLNDHGRQPRQWHRTEDIPADVKTVRDADGGIAERSLTGVGWWWTVDADGRTALCAQMNKDGHPLIGAVFPVTEVIE